jgi:hypothetical protein
MAWQAARRIYRRMMAPPQQLPAAAPLTVASIATVCAGGLADLLTYDAVELPLETATRVVCRAGRQVAFWRSNEVRMEKVMKDAVELEERQWVLNMVTTRSARLASYLRGSLGVCSPTPANWKLGEKVARDHLEETLDEGYVLGVFQSQIISMACKLWLTPTAVDRAIGGPVFRDGW